MSDNNFDLITTGVGFINRFRLNKPEGGTPYYSMAIAAMHGKANDEGKVKKTYIDCNVVGPAIEMTRHIEACFEDDEEPAIMVKFVAGDLEQRSFIYKSGAKQGQQGFALKARVFDIKWYRVNGETYYSEAERQRHAEQDQATNDVSVDDGENDQAEPLDVPAMVLPQQVKLVKDDPYFDERKAQLKTQGYHWDAQINLWVLPQTAAA